MESSSLTPRRPSRHRQEETPGPSTTDTLALAPLKELEDESARELFSPTNDGNDTDGSSSSFRSRSSSRDDQATSCLPEEKRKRVERKCMNHVPFSKQLLYLINLCPPRVRVLLLSVWVLWKVILGLVFLHMVFFTTAASFSSSDGGVTRDMKEVHLPGDPNDNTAAPRVLYIITTLAEFNTGQRKTEKGQDRLGEVLIPILVDSVESMVHDPFNYHVDVFFISAYELKPEREQYIRSRLPNGVGFEVWDDACPQGYEAKHSPNKVIDNTRALARQHRYVIKDKLEYYDLFVAFEDDMRITGDQVRQYLQMSTAIEKLRQAAPKSLPGLVPENMDPKQMRFFGSMTKDQLDRVVPGFIRVEVLLNEDEYGAQTKLDSIETDFYFDLPNEGRKEIHLDPRPCCHVQMSPNKNTPVHPYPKDVVIWETNVKALSVRKLPGLPPSAASQQSQKSYGLDWVGILPGPGKKLDAKYHVGGYWSGRGGAFGDEEKPSGGRPDIIAQQGGWMATRSQILRMNNDGLCMGSFIPPFDEPIFKEDGQQSMNVEFWSGGYQFFTGVRGGCNMQRIISLEPHELSSHFLYHVANNKQRQLNRERMLRADNLLGQLNTVRKAAENAFVEQSTKL